MKKFCKDIRWQAMNIIKYEKKKKKERAWIIYWSKTLSYTCKRAWDNNSISNNNNNRNKDKIREHCHYTCKYRGAAHNIFDLKYKIPKKML